MGKKHSEDNTTRVLVVIFTLFVVVIVFFLAILSKSPATTSTNDRLTSAVSQVDGTQYIDLTAKGGFFPSSIVAKANINTTLRVTTSNTFDCSSSISIPSLNYRNNLPPTGTTEVNIPAQSQNSEIKGTCSMGMYRFSIKFI